MSKHKPFIHKVHSDTDIEAYLPKLSINDTISEKMKKLCQMSILSNYDITKRQRILNYIHSLFQPFYPDCSLVAFGSSINSFGTKGCDLDMMFLPSPDYEHLDASEINFDEEAPTIGDAKSNPSVVARLKYMDKEKQFRFLLRVLRSSRHHAVYIPAKIPIVRCFISHEYYHLWCDLSFHQSLPKFNSELLRFFSTVDSRVKSLMITLRFWAKHLNIISTGAFSSYAFSLLVIFFLQNIEEPLLPPVNDLMINAASCVVEGWEAGFVSDLGQDFKSINTLSEEELLKEFFRFYWNFDFARNVVCIRTGKTMPVSDIRKDADERMRNFMIGDVCVQDPFNLSHNVTSSVKLLRLHLLKPYFFVASLILSKELKSPGCEDVFRQLFKKQLFESKIQEEFFHPKSDFSDLLSPKSDISEYFHVYPNSEIIAAIGDDFKKIWFEQVCQAIRDILEYIFFFDCEVIDKNDSIKNTDFDDGYSESNYKHDKLLLSIQCAVDNKMWKYRNTKITVPGNTDELPVPEDSYTENFTNKVLKEENAMSHFLLDSCSSLQSPEPFLWFLCNCYQSRYSQIPYMWINLIPLCSNTKEFKSVSNLLTRFITRTVDKMLKNQCF